LQVVKGTDSEDLPSVAAPSGKTDMSSDEELMLEFQKGATEAFTELFQRYAQRLYGFFRRRLDQPARAEELTQDVFVAVLKGAARYEPRALFRTYLYSIAVRMLNVERRKSS